ncbi:MAG: hypothetical protein QHH27_11350 [Clostridia bacterium]|nr:hypothetical protein [Clostridia bacterium]
MAGRDRVRALVRELRQLGYYEFQIREIIQEIAGTADIDKLSSEAAQKVGARLAEQVAFARRCLNVQS